MLLVGLTGGIATGKTSVAAILSGLNCALVDADQIARDLVRPSSPGLEALYLQFGREILDDTGALNRPYLGKIVFHDPAARDRLNEILHPLIIGRIQTAIEEYRHEGGRIVVVDAPLLYETGLDSLMDCVIVVYTDAGTQRERLMKRDKLSEEEARLRMASQLPLEDKVKKADFIIDNSGSPAATEQQVKEVWTKFKDRYRGGSGTGQTGVRR